GRAEDGAVLIAELEGEIEEAVAKHPAIAGKSVMFLTHVDTTDLSTVNFYTAHDTRTMFFEDLGMTIAQSVQDASAETEEFSSSVSAEQADVFDDVAIIVTYGDEALVEALQADPLLSQMPAVENGSVVHLPGDSPLCTAANPPPRSIPHSCEDYLVGLDRTAIPSTGPASHRTPTAPCPRPPPSPPEAPPPGCGGPPARACSACCCSSRRWCSSPSAR